MIKILIADSHPIVRNGLKQILSETPDMMVAGEALSGQETLDLVQTQDWDVILLDISTPDKSGLEVLKQLKEQHPKLPVLVLTIYPEDRYTAVRVLKAGASGYLTRESTPDQLIDAIQKVIQGGKYVSASLAKKLAFDLAGDPEKLWHETLSNREYQVMYRIASGKNIREIAQELGLSMRSINTYRIRILHKTGLKNNAEIIRYALESRLLD